MNNGIRHLEVRDRSVVPAEAEMWITVVPERQTAGTEVRGRLMGPRCLYAATVEVAYPLRPLPRPGAETGITSRVVVPEASLWEPESPFLYEGFVELWQDGTLCERVSIRHGLRQFSVGTRGLRVNSRLLTVRGREVTRCSEDEARALRQAGYNLLIVPAPPDEAVLEVADRVGFLVLVSPRTAVSRPVSRACWLGWVVGAGDGDAGEPLPEESLFRLSPSESGMALIGPGGAVVGTVD
jgi:hypothetical protein